ncbi:MAG: UvrD-helicase domain-containing protein, partial [Clostridiales bacterium]|nr:UvrD-helicase domain-containing protein [Clostridiales bacterium]
LAVQLHEAYGHLKRRQRLWDYNDLEHLALQALKNPLAGRDVAESLDAVFVDEYQDISRIQEAIIARLRDKADLFMVGDVKQSIYRFRLADPGLFLRKYEAFEKPEDAPQRLIVLSQNFRSRTNILRAVNRVFEGAMRRDVTEITYDEDAALRREPDTTGDPPVELHLLTAAAAEPEEPETDDALPGEDSESGVDLGGNLVWEARLMADRMKELHGTMMTDKDGPQQVAWRDMVVLMRSVAGRADQVARILTDAGIPTFSDAGAQYFDLREVDDVLNILKVLDNPMQDVPLMAALSTPCLGFSHVDLGYIRAATPSGDVPFYQAFANLVGRDDKVTRAAQQQKEWRFKSQNMSVETFLRYFLRASGLYARAGALPAGELRRANLRLLCERAMNLGPSMSLSGFLQRVSDARKREDGASAATLGEDEDVVRILTIHKSKGLEFPIVFLPGMSRVFRMASQGELLQCDPALGLSLRLRDEEKRITHLTFSGRAMMNADNRAIRSEEARLLYVAMTRARDRLILLAAPRSLPASMRQWSLPAGDYAAGSARSMMDWVGNALWPALETGEDAIWTAPGGSVWDIRWRSADAFVLPRPAARPERPPWPDKPTTPSPFVPLPRVSAALQKISVTALLECARAGDIEEETPEIKRRLRQLQQPPMALPVLGQKKRMTGAERGIAAHKALSGLSLDALRGKTGEALVDAVREGLDVLAGKDILTPEERGAADARAIAGFFESSLGVRVLSADRVEREWSFTLKTEGNFLLQGVIDCCLAEDNAWVLMDYKTDPDDRDGIMDKYRDQMRWYMRAMREITGLPVKDAYLYSLSRHTAWRVEEDRPISLDEYARRREEPPQG